MTEQASTDDSGIEIFDGGRDAEVSGATEQTSDTADPDDPDDPDETGDTDVEAVDAERERRLDADHRPDHAEVDNTGRDFDPEVGMFTDSDGYDAQDRRYAADPEGQD